MKSIRKIQRGFSLISAIFLLVVIAALGTFAVTISSSQQQGIAMDLLGARAYQASRAGIEWGAFQILQNLGACAPTTNFAAGTFAGTMSGFNVAVTCVALPPYNEVNAPSGVRVYNLTSTATLGIVGAPNYVERQMSVTIAK